MTPAWPQPVSTTRPLPRTSATSAWSSRMSGSGRHPPSRWAWWLGALPCSKSVVRSISPVTRSTPPSRNDGSRCSTTAKPAPSSAARLGDGRRTGSRPGSAIRRRLQASGWSTTGSPAGPSTRTSPCIPPDVVEVPVTEDDRLDVARRELQAPHVLDDPVGRDAGVEQDGVPAVAPGQRDERGEAVLGAQRVERLAAVEHGSRDARARAERWPLCGPLVVEQDVRDVVDERRDRQRVDGLEGDGLELAHAGPRSWLGSGGQLPTDVGAGQRVAAAPRRR